MELHALPKINKKRSQRVGRGGKRGTTSGRGTKGQRSRAGHRIRPALRDLIIRIPKRRGFRNKPKSEKALVLDIAILLKKATVFAGAGSEKSPITIDMTFLGAAGILPSGYRGEVKVLGKGEVKQPVVLKGLKTSKAVALQIEKAGGKIEA
jgi:large subunit ribosomal protein L15